MSQTIDDRIVALEFDNRQFEKGVSESLTTLDKLKESLDLKDAGKNLSKISQEASKIDLSHLNDSVENLNEKFSTLRITGLMALSNLVDGAMELAKKLGSVLTAPFRQAMTGGWNRALNIEQAKFQLEGLGVAWSDISEDINYGVQDTAYGLDVAAKAASQLVASGVKVGDTMKHSLLAISGVASMTNSAYEEISPIFTTVAGQGVLMTRQLRQLEMRGLNAAAVLGQQLGVSEAAVREMVHNGQINFQQFSDAMYEAFGQHAKDANNTFTGALSNIKAALNKIGAEFATPIMTNAIPVFNSVRQMINAMKANMSELFKIFAKITENIGGKLKKSIDNITDFLNNRFTGIYNLNRALAITVNSLMKIGKTISTAFRQVFNGSMGDHINNLAKSIERIAETLAPTDNSLKGLHGILVLIFSIIKKGGQAASFVIKYIGGPIATILVKTIQLLLSIIGIITDLIKGVSGVSKETSLFKVIIAGLLTLIDKIKNKFSELTVKLSDSSTHLGRINDKIKNVLNNILNILKVFAAISAVGIMYAFDKIRNLNFSKAIDGIKMLLMKIKDMIYTVKNIPEIQKAIDNIKIIFDGLNKVFNAALSAAKKFFQSFRKESSKTETSFRKDALSITKVFEGIGSILTILGYLIGKATLKLISIGNNLFDFFRNFKFENLVKGLNDFINSVKRIGLLDTLANRARTLGGFLGTFFENLINKIKLFIANVKESGSVIEYLVDRIKKLTSKSKESTTIDDSLIPLSSGINSKNNSILNFFDLVKSKFTSLKESLVSGLAKIREEGLLTKVLMVGWILAIIKALVTFSNNSKKITNAMVKGTGMFKAFKGFGDLMSGLLNPLKSLTNLIKEVRKKTGSEKFAVVMKSLALGLGVLSVSLIAIYKVVDDIDKFNSVATTLGIFMGIMSIVAAQIAIFATKIKDTDTELVNTFFWNMISMAAVIGSLTKALVKLSDIPWNDMAKGLTGISILFAYVWTTQLVLAKIGKTTGTLTKTIKGTIKGMLTSAANILKITSAILLIGASLILMAVAIKKIKSLGLSKSEELDDVIIGFTLIGLIFMAVISAAQYCKSAMVGILQLSGAMALLGVSANLIIIACKLFKKVKVDEIIKVGAVYAAILILFKIISNKTDTSGITKGVIAMGLAFSLLANAAIKLALVAKIMKNVDWSQIAKTMVIFAAIVVSVGLLVNSLASLKNGQTWKPILATLLGLASIVGAVTILSLMVSNDKNFIDLIKATGLLSVIILSLAYLLKSAGKIKDSKGVLVIASMIAAIASIIVALRLLLPLVQNGQDFLKIIAIAATLDLTLFGLIKMTESFLKFSKENKLGNGKWAVKGFTALGLMLAAFAAIAAIIIVVGKTTDWYEVIAISASLSAAILALATSAKIISGIVKNISWSELGKAAGVLGIFIPIFAILGLVISALTLIGTDAGKMFLYSQTISLTLLELSAIAMLLGNFSTMITKSLTALPALLALTGVFVVLGLVLGALTFIGADAKEMLKSSQVIMLCLLELTVIAIILGAIPMAGLATVALPALLGLVAVFAILGVVLGVLSLIGADAKQMLKTSQIVMLCLLELSVIATLLGLLPVAGLAAIALPALLGLVAIFAILAIVLGVLSMIGVDAKEMLKTSQIVMLCLLELSGICALLGLLAPVAAVALLSEVALVALIGIMYLLGKLMEYLAEVNVDKALPKLEKMKDFLWSLVGLMAVLGALSVAGIAGGVALIVLSAGIAALSAALIYMSNVDFDLISSGINSLIIPLGILVGFGMVGIPAGTGLIVFAAGIAALGAACLVSALGVKALAEVIAGIGEKVSEASKSAVEGAQKIVDGFVEKFGAIKTFVEDTIKAISDMLSGSTVLGSLKDAGSKMGGGLVNAFREATGWHSPPAFIVKFFEDAGIAVNRNANGLTDLFEGTGETWGSALSKALGNKFDITAILEDLKTLFGDVEIAGLSLDDLMNMLDTTSKSIAQQRKELAMLYKEGKIAHDDFNNKMKQLSEQEKKTQKTTNNLTSSFDSLNTSLTTTTSTTKSFRDTLKSTLESQMNIFSKFEKKLDLTKEELLENMRSQITGMSDWAAQMQYLATMGIDKGLYQKLAEMGPEGAEYVNAFANMTAEEMVEANALWAQSLVLPGNLAKELNISWKSISKNMVNGLSAGWTDTAGIFHENVLATSQEAQEAFMTDNGIHSPSRVYKGFGTNLVMGLDIGIREHATKPSDAILYVSELTYKKAQLEFSATKYFKIGSNISQGIEQGIKSNSGPIYSILADIGAKADKVLRKVTEVKSPSRVFAEIGKFWDLGLAKGVGDNANAVYNSVEDMGNNAIQTMKYTVAKIASNLIDDMKDPVIKPILDLSNVESGIKTLNGVFNSNRAIMASGKVAELQNAQGNVNPSIQFTQINNSPKALSRIDIYRDTRNLFAQAKGALS